MNSDTSPIGGAVETHGSSSSGVREPSQSGNLPPLPLLLRQLLPGTVLFVVIIKLVAPVSDPDTFWHIKAGDHLRASWTFSGPDPWSAMSTRPWVLHEWLPELPMSLMAEWGGLPAVAWLLPLGGAFIGLALWRGVRERASLLASSVVMALGVLAMTQSLSLRPHLVTFALTTITVAAWLRTTEDGKPRWWLIPLSWFWASSHGMWFVGVAIGGAVLLGLALDRRTSRREWTRLLVIPLGSVVAAALTPSGPMLLAAPFAVSEMTDFVAEWAPPSVREPAVAAFLALALIIVLVWARSPGRVPWVHVAVLVLGVGVGLVYSRTVAVGTAMIAPIAAGALQSVLPTKTEKSSRREVVLTAGLTAVGLAIAALMVPTRAVEPGWGANDLSDRLASLPSGSVVCNDYGLGGWLLWGHPHLKPTIDGRTEIFSLEHVESHVKFESAHPGWSTYIDETHCGWALVDADLPVSEALTRQLRWEVVDRGREFVLLKAPT